MGSLTTYLQAGFEAECPAGWTCHPEERILDTSASKRLGFQPRADVLLKERVGTRRIWIEFEISRADPVANHAKFAAARYFEGAPTSEVFVSMASRHIVTGRAALGAATAMMLRGMGLSAFQVDLLPAHDGPSIKRLNAMPLKSLEQSGAIDARTEIKRVLAVSDSMLVAGWRHRIHKADNSFTVAMNARQWNREMTDPGSKALWKRRSVQYFVYDPASGMFAPSKFCAFIPATQVDAQAMPFTSVQEPPGGMSVSLYAILNEDDPRFDGHVARKHLVNQLGYRLQKLDDAPGTISEAFWSWHARFTDDISLRQPVSILSAKGHPSN